MQGQIRVVAGEAAFAFSVSFEVQGRRATIPAIDVLRFDEDGRIVQMRTLFGPGNSSAG